MFGEVEQGIKAKEESNLMPQSPYGISKAASYLQVKNYRISLIYNKSVMYIKEHK
jgi:GDP-D-mannose dehydratase